MPSVSLLRNAKKCGGSRVRRRPQAQRHLTFLPDAVTSHAKTPVPAEAQNLQGKEPATVDLCRFKVSALKRPQSSFADWYSKERRQRESRAKACPRFALALSPSPASVGHHIQNHNRPKLNRCETRNQSGNRNKDYCFKAIVLDEYCLCTSLSILFCLISHGLNWTINEINWTYPFDYTISNSICPII